MDLPNTRLLVCDERYKKHLKQLENANHFVQMPVKMILFAIIFNGMLFRVDERIILIYIHTDEKVEELALAWVMEIT